jgi:hypothetical protein
MQCAVHEVILAKILRKVKKKVAVAARIVAKWNATGSLGIAQDGCGAIVRAAKRSLTADKRRMNADKILNFAIGVHVRLSAARNLPWRPRKSL